MLRRPVAIGPRAGIRNSAGTPRWPSGAPKWVTRTRRRALRHSPRTPPWGSTEVRCRSMLGRRAAGCRKPLPPCRSSAMPRSRSILTRSASRCPGPLAGHHGARHGTYRVVNRIAENGSIVTSSTSAAARRFPAACNA